ncbi:MAG: carboxypeptidase regulatory-like domain-containing protein [Muribaculaceae bacterium]|nr:carboxypeptidase regulatory-like domain-containing protein [Muribaculaceae bacterium]
MKRLASLLLLIALTAGIVQAKGLKGKVIYVNPGHGGWTANDRPLATINYEEMDTMSFFETKSNLWKGLELRDRLEKAGAKVVMSRTRNGYVTEGQKNATPRDQVETWSDENGQQQLVTLQTIAMNVDSINPDYFISMHSNATGGEDGKLCNYLALVYRGETGNDYAKGSIARAEQAYPYIWDNPLTVWTSSSPDNPFIAGDLTWMGAPPPGDANKLGYTGYLSVLKHHVPCFLAEGSFHSYQPERQRLLNRDYCRYEGLRYYRAINAWFGGKGDKNGHIVGTVKSATEHFEHPLYKYVPDSDDQWKPINGAMVYLKDKHGVTVRAYRTDNEYNGFFSFYDVKPGKYTIVVEATGYNTMTISVKVKANEINHIMPRL